MQHEVLRDTNPGRPVALVPPAEPRPIPDQPGQAAADESAKRLEISILLEARRTTEETIRAFDIKAQIAGVGMILSITALASFGVRILPPLPAPPGWLGYGLCGYFLLCISQFAWVLWPKRSLIIKPGDPAPRTCGTFFVQPGRTSTLADYVTAIQRTDWTTELAFEVMKLAQLRESKRRRFQRALAIAASFYVVLLAALAVAVGGNPGAFTGS
jgi:hypothetical protein